MVAIVGALPVTLQNGTLADANQVMSNFTWIASQVNANAATLSESNAFTGTQTIDGQNILVTTDIPLSQRIVVGVTTDGTGDNTTLIQTALDAAGVQVRTLLAGNVNLVTCHVFLPAGRIAYTGTLTIPDGVTLEGDSTAGTILLPTVNGVAINMGDGIANISNCWIRNLSLVGNAGGSFPPTVFGTWTSTTSVGIQMNLCIRNCGLENVFISLCTTSIKTVGSFQWTIRSCFGLYALLHHIWSDNGSVSKVVDCRFDWNEDPVGGIYIDGTSASNETVGLTLDNVACQICQGNGLYAFDTTQIRVINSHFESNNRAASLSYADMNFQPGPNSRGRLFVVQNTFMTPGTSPAGTVYTGIRVKVANAVLVTGCLARDARYAGAVDVLTGPSTVARLDGVGNDFTGCSGKFLYDPTVTDLVFEEQDGVGVKTISKLLAGGLRYVATVTSSNASTDGRKCDFYLSTAAGSRTVTLLDAQCIAGTHIEVVKTSADGNSLIVAPQTKLINGGATASTTTAYGSMIIGSDGTNWFVKAKV